MTNAQKQIEGRNFDTRKNLLDYDDVLAKQRQIIYDRRDSILLAKDIEDMIHDFFAETGLFLAKKATQKGKDDGLIDAEALRKLVEPAFVPEGSFPYKAYDEAPVDEGGADLGEFLYGRYLQRKKDWPKEVSDQIERSISLSVIDRNWTRHIDTMSHLREGIGLRSYAQTNPLQDYVNEGYAYFREMNTNISVDCVYNFLNVKPRINVAPAAPKKEEQPSSEEKPAGENKPAEETKPAVEQKPAEEAKAEPAAEPVKEEAKAETK